MDRTEPKRTQVALGPTTAAALEQLSTRTGMSQAAILRHVLEGVLVAEPELAQRLLVRGIGLEVGAAAALTPTEG